jgi:hypothetical protein
MLNDEELKQAEEKREQLHDALSALARACSKIDDWEPETRVGSAMHDAYAAMKEKP